MRLPGIAFAPDSCSAPQRWQRLPQSWRGGLPRLLVAPPRQRAEAPPAPVGLTPTPRDIAHGAPGPPRQAPGTAPPPSSPIPPTRGDLRRCPVLIRFLPKIFSVFPPFLGVGAVQLGGSLVIRHRSLFGLGPGRFTQEVSIKVLKISAHRRHHVSHPRHHVLQPRAGATDGPEVSRSRQTGTADGNWSDACDDRRERERYWTVVSEMEVESLEKYTEMSRKSMEIKEFQEAMKGYHELIDHGRREIYSIET